MREEFPARNEGQDKVEESGVHTAADHLHYEGVADVGEDPLLILHVFDLLVPDDILQGHDLEGVELVRLLMLAEQYSGELAWREHQFINSLRTLPLILTCSYRSENFQVLYFYAVPGLQLTGSVTITLHADCWSLTALGPARPSLYHLSPRRVVKLSRQQRRTHSRSSLGSALSQ